MSLANYRILSCLLISFFLVSQEVTAQSRCEWLLKYGIYNTEEVYTERYTYEHLRTLLKTSYAKTVQQFKEQAANVGLDITPFLGLSFGGSTAETNFSSWRRGVLETSFHEVIGDESKVRVIRTISPELMQTVRACIEKHEGLVVFVTPSVDDISFNLNVKYRTTSRKAKIKSINVTTTSAGEIYPLFGEDLIKPGAELGSVVLTYQRPTKSDAMMFAINTDSGTAEFRIPPADFVDPVDLLSRVSALERDHLSTADQLKGVKADLAKLTDRTTMLETTLKKAGAKAWVYFNNSTGEIYARFNVARVDIGKFPKVHFQNAVAHPYVVVATGQGPQPNVALGAINVQWFDLRQLGPEDHRVFAVVFGN